MSNNLIELMQAIVKSNTDRVNYLIFCSAVFQERENEND